MTIVVTIATMSCSGQDFGFLQPTPEDLCNCLPLEPDTADYRHVAKHVPIPNEVPQEVSVHTILTWPEGSLHPARSSANWAGTSGLHIANAFLQNAAVNAVDCDISMEISETPDKSAPRMIVETPVKTCPLNLPLVVVSAVKMAVYPGMGTPTASASLIGGFQHVFLKRMNDLILHILDSLPKARIRRSVFYKHARYD